MSAYESQTRIGWDQFIKGRISLEWSALIRFEYSKHQVIQQSATQRPKYRTPETWAKGLIVLNWEFVNLLWEQRISSVTSQNPHPDKRDNHYFLLQKAYKVLNSHQIINLQDQHWLLKTQEDIDKMSINQLILWIHNMNLIHKINVRDT